MKTLVLCCLAALALAACAEEPMGLAPPTPSPAFEPGGGAVFRDHDFAWSTARGTGSINGALAFRAGGVRYSCAGGDVILTPETPWSRRRMFILYGSVVSAAVPLDVVRARTPSASSGDYASYVRKTTCTGAEHFSFAGLPDGGWYVITLAKPLGGGGEAVAVMRRVETRGGARTVTLY